MRLNLFAQIIQDSLMMMVALNIVSCSNSHRNSEIKVSDTTFISDNFENMDDTASFNVDKGNLIGKIVTLDVGYGAIECTCAQWSETKYSNSMNNRPEFFLEPANPSLINADALYKGDKLGIRVLVTGQFYAKKGFPKNYYPVKGDPAPARVFRYSKIKVISFGKAPNK